MVQASYISNQTASKLHTIALPTRSPVWSLSIIRNCVHCHLATCSTGHITSWPPGRSCELFIKEEVHLFEQKDCSPRPRYK